MPSKQEPKKGIRTEPRFLDGKAPPSGLRDPDRRKSLARAITDKSNYWFAAAFVNRMWGELMGQAFYMPVDDMGPQKEAVFPNVLTRLAGSFRGSNYDVKILLRDLMNTDAYQRQIRLAESTDQHLHFSAAYPTRLRADALWHSLVNVLGSFGGQAMPNRPGAGPYRGPQGLEGVFKFEFDFDPSLRSDDVEGSIPQALMLMNNPAINQKIQARGANLLGRILEAYTDNTEALRMVYLRTLARKPTDRELDKCRQHLKNAATRAEGFEDVLWALLNSTEFQTKR
jgi:uncharacterized protein DUF1553